MKKMISAASYTRTGSDKDVNRHGLPNNHAFSVMDVLTVSDKDGIEHRLVGLRNPWGREKFRGQWSNDSELWTADLLR